MMRKAKAPRRTLYKVAEVAEMCGVTVRHLRTLIALGKVKTVPIGRRAVRVPAAEVERLALEGVR